MRRQKDFVDDQEWPQKVGATDSWQKGGTRKTRDAVQGRAGLRIGVKRPSVSSSTGLVCGPEPFSACRGLGDYCGCLEVKFFFVDTSYYIFYSHGRRNTIICF